MQTIVTPRILEEAKAPSFLAWLKRRLFPRPVRRDQSWSLARGQLTRLALSQGARFCCERGTVWMTSDEGGPDIIMTAGEDVEFVSRTIVLVEALQESRLTLRA